MPGWLESLLVALFLAVGEKLAVKGKIAYEEWQKISGELKQAEENAKKYAQEIKDAADREARRKAEDDFFS